MIDQERCKAIYSLFEEGVSIMEISRCFRISRNTIRSIIKNRGVCSPSIRKDKLEVNPDLLTRLYSECNGFIQRIHEKLLEEEKITIGYSTLTRMVRELGLRVITKKKRCADIPEVPGVEQQQDTTIYTVKIGEKRIKVIASIIYYRYSKIRYLKFYRTFNRFKMKCFFHEALTFWGYSAHECIIDNTNLARLRGAGKNAVIVPEMVNFAKQYGFKFICHEIDHPNRKAGNERSFYTVETNFFPGRTFISLEDLNRQALNWATERMPNRPVSKTGLIPCQTFEYEKAYLIKLPAYIPPPYLNHRRKTDQYGYISFNGNYYWIPGTERPEVTVLQYSDHLIIYQKRNILGRYQLPSEEIKNEIINPEGLSRPANKPKYRKNPTAAEEKKLCSQFKEINSLFDFALPESGMKKHNFIRQLYAMSQKLAPAIFSNTIKRALKYRIKDINTIERIALLMISDGDYEIPLVETDYEFKNRESFKEGHLSEDPDLSIYDRLLEEDENDE